MATVSISTNSESNDETALLFLKNAEAKRENARLRKAKSRQLIMNDPERKQAALENARAHFKTHYHNKLKLEEAESTITTEGIGSARQKWDQAYRNRQKLLADIRKIQSEMLWHERSLEQRKMYKDAKKIKRVER